MDQSRYANTASVSEEDRVLLESVTGRVPSSADENLSVEAEEIREKSVGSRPVSDKTSGSGDLETADGLDETDEMVRHMAEDTTDDQPSEDEADLPVFDRGETV